MPVVLLTWFELQDGRGETQVLGESAETIRFVFTSSAKVRTRKLA